MHAENDLTSDKHSLISWLLNGNHEYSVISKIIILGKVQNQYLGNLNEVYLLVIGVVILRQGRSLREDVHKNQA
jgi:hypothetical protein